MTPRRPRARATAAFLGPRRARRLNLRCQKVPLAFLAHIAAWTRMVRRYLFPLRVGAFLDLPADSSLPGLRPLQEEMCLAEGKTLMSGPVSARTAAAATSSIPGILMRR